MYILILFTSLITYIVGNFSKKLGPFYLLALMLTLVAGFRGKFVGRDTEYYHDFFNSLLVDGYVRSIENGYILLVKFIIAIGGTQQLIFLIFSGFTIYCFCKFILKFSNNPYLSILIFILVGPLYLSTFNQVRQYLAIGIFLAYLIPLIQKRKKIKYFLIVLATAYFIHTSAIILIPFYFILNKKISLIKKIGIIVIFNLITSFIVSLILMTPYRYFILIRDEIEVGKALFVFQIIISFLLLFTEKSILKLNENRRIFYNMAYFSIFMLLPLFINKNMPVEIFIRMNNYFFPFVIILIPDFLEKFNKKSNQILTFLLIILLSAYFYRNTIILGEFYNLVPYEINTNLFSNITN